MPGRSPDPARYRDVIAATTNKMLLAIVAGDSFSDVDPKRALRAAYPEWFAEEGVAVSNIQQRFARGCADVVSLLQSVVRRDEIYS